MDEWVPSESKKCPNRGTRRGKTSYLWVFVVFVEYAYRSHCGSSVNDVISRSDFGFLVEELIGHLVHLILRRGGVYFLHYLESLTSAHRKESLKSLLPSLFLGNLEDNCRHLRFLICTLLGTLPIIVPPLMTILTRRTP